MRADEQAIFVGTKTALNDNPSLTTRSWEGENPLRVVLDRKLKIPVSYNLYDGSVKTIILNEVKNDKDLTKRLFFEKIDFSKNVPTQVCEVLYKYEIQSVIVEGGAQTLQSFINANLWDEAFVFVGAINFKKGIKAPELQKVSSEIRKISNDNLFIYKNK